MVIDVRRLRDETPGTRHVLHFNNAGASLPPAPVVQAQKRYLEREAQIGGYETAAEYADERESVYAKIAQMLGCTPGEVALTENATRAWDMAFYSLARTFEPGDRIVTSRASYASNYLAFLHVAQDTGVIIDVVPPDESGQVDVHALENRLDEHTRLIALTHVPTNNGLVNPARDVGEVAAQADVPFLLDACQSAGQMPLQVDELQCTMLSATGRKYLRGPRGTGFLYVRQDWIDRLTPPVIDLHAATWTAEDSFKLRDDARRFEGWEANMAARIGLGKAVSYALEIGLENIWNRIAALARQLRTQLREIDGITLYDRGATKGGIVTFTHDQLPSSELSDALRKENINTSVSSPSSTLLDAEARELPDLVRASLHYYNSMDEIDRFCNRLDLLRLIDTSTT